MPPQPQLNSQRPEAASERTQPAWPSRITSGTDCDGDGDGEAFPPLGCQPRTEGVPPPMKTVGRRGRSSEELEEELEEEEEVESSTGPRLKRRTMGGPNLKDDLSEIVREDPDAAASILRNWLSSAG